MNQDIKIAIIGLGYVGLPLAVAFAKKYHTVGFDINTNRVKELNEGIDHTLEVSNGELKDVIHNQSDQTGLTITSDTETIKTCNYYIVTVPTPTDKNNRPVLTPLIKASETVARVLSKEDIIYTSLLYIQE